jgi:hypothetical protein
MTRAILGVVCATALYGAALYSSNVAKANTQPPPEPIATLREDRNLDIGGPSGAAIWGRCWLTIDTKHGDVRIYGEDKDPCIDALDRAVRLARAEIRVNRKRR